MKKCNAGFFFQTYFTNDKINCIIKSLVYNRVYLVGKIINYLKMILIFSFQLQAIKFSIIHNRRAEGG